MGDALTSLRAAVEAMTPPWFVSHPDSYWQVLAYGSREVAFDDGSAGGEYRAVCSPRNRDAIVALVNAALELIAVAEALQVECDAHVCDGPPECHACAALADLRSALERDAKETR